MSSATRPATTGAANARGHEWTITLAPDGMRVEMDGSLLFESDRPIVARQVEVAAGELHAEVTATTPGVLRTAMAAVDLRAGSQRLTLPADSTPRSSGPLPPHPLPTNLSGIPRH